MTTEENKAYLQYVLPAAAKSVIDIRRMSPRMQALYNRGGISSFPGMDGLGGKKTLEPVVNPVLGAAAKRISSAYVNSSITFDSDRIDYLTSGYGGKGIPSPSCRLVAGEGGGYARNTDEKGGRLNMNPSFQLDGATMYLSQLTDVDENFNLPAGNVGNIKGQSAAVMKADSIRFMARDGGIKLVTNGSVRNSQTRRALERRGILFATGGRGNYAVPKGEILVEALKEMMQETADLRQIVNSFVTYQRNFNNIICSHNHHGAFWGLIGAPSFALIFDGVKTAFQLTAETEGSVIKSSINQAIEENNYFNPLSEKFILNAMVGTS